MKSVKPIFTALLLLQFSTVFSQLNYTTAQYPYDSLLNISYGSAIDYAGNPQNLILDIYKPRNSYCNRPIIMMVHGGAWVSGSKADADMIFLSRFFVKRGYVVANINYRLGTHKASSYSMYALCNNSISAPCAYISDSSEIYRANYRAMQDLKGAIRFMKSRHLTDSTDYNNVFLVGESAGGFISMTAAFLTGENEKNANCDSISNAPYPDSDMYTYGCIPNPVSYYRPDLGSVDGDLHTGVYDASVQGVASFFGGLLEPTILSSAEINNKAIYMFHQGSDVIVNYNSGKLLGRMSWECYAQTNLCQTYYFYPIAYGGKGLNTYITSLVPSPAHYQVDIIENYEYLNDCLDNGHAIDNLSQRGQNAANLFAAKIFSNSNQPTNNCHTGINENLSESYINLYPNPASNQITIRSEMAFSNEGYTITDLSGKTLQQGKLHGVQTFVDITQLSCGVYILNIRNQHFRFIKQ